MDRRHVLTLLALFVFAGIAMGQYTREEPAPSYAYLNRLRAAVGMTPLRRNAQLERAADLHAGYLAVNRAAGHFQQPGRPSFSGATPAERVRAAGYAQARSGENAAAGNTNGIEAIDGLMAAIYHRLGFLSFNFDEVGIGARLAHDPAASRFVYDMGDSEQALSALCADLPADALFSGAGRYYELCPQRVRIRYEAYAALQARLENSIALGNPRMVLWPPQGATDVPPAFFEESPDPLPDLSVSGYPVSLQFNPAYVSRAVLRSLRIFRLDVAPDQTPSDAAPPDPGRLRELTHTRLLTSASDPNGKLGPREFALFPLERLAWNQHYAVRAEFEADGEAQVLWRTFRTRDPGAPLVTVEATGETLPLLPGKRYALYVPPTRRQPTTGRMSYVVQGGMSPQLEPIDPNTIALRVEGPVCASGEFMLAGGRSFRVRLAAADNLAGAQPPQVLYAPCGEYAADFRVRGAGEQLQVKSGQSYAVHLPPGRSGKAIGRFSWSYTSGIEANFEFQDENTLRVRTSGPTGGLVTVKFPDGRSFSLRIVE